MTQAQASFSTSGDQVKIVRVTESQRELAKLPPPGVRRWVMRRKAQVVAAVRKNVLSLEDACTRYHLSEEEFNSWAKLLDRHGMHGLRATRIQEYRSQSDQGE